jgi:hypothetical protein
MEDTLVPHHRANRGIGGSKLLDRPANILVVCAWLNGAMESDPKVAAMARSYGWKLARWQTPEDTPFYDRATELWWLLDDQFNRVTTIRKAS